MRVPAAELVAEMDGLLTALAARTILREEAAEPAAMAPAVVVQELVLPVVPGGPVAAVVRDQNISVRKKIMPVLMEAPEVPDTELIRLAHCTCTEP